MARKIKSSEENDVYSRWRYIYIWPTQRPGRIKKIKRRTHKRERREGKRAIGEEL